MHTKAAKKNNVTMTLRLAFRRNVRVDHFVAALRAIYQLYGILYVAYGPVDKEPPKKMSRRPDDGNILNCSCISDLYVKSCSSRSVQLDIGSAIGEPLKVLAEWLISYIDPRRRKKERLAITNLELKSRLLEEAVRKKEVASVKEIAVLKKELAELGIGFVMYRALPMYEALRKRGLSAATSERLFVNAIGWVESLARTHDETRIIISLHASKRPALK